MRGPARISAHGVGGAQDLPIPLEFAVAGAGCALVASFVILGLAWRRPRYVGESGALARRLTTFVDSPVTRVGLRVAGLAFFAYVAWAAVFGPDLATNPTFGVVYVLVWVGLVPASLLFGPVWRLISPVRTLHGLLALVTSGVTRTAPFKMPRQLGYWPAAIGLFAFVWLELVYATPNYLGPVRLWIAVYVASMLVGAALFGETWFARADPFEVYSDLVAHLSVVGRRVDGVLEFRSPLRNLASLKAGPGTVSVVSVLLGSTAYDSFSRSSRWVTFIQSTSADPTVLGTVALAGFCLFVGASFSLASVLSAEAGVAGGRRSLPRFLAHSIVPIVVGYVVAHYITLFIVVGQRTVGELSDPMGTGADLLGTADYPIQYLLVDQPTLLASIKVGAVVLGHVVGVVASHDRALEVLPAHRKVTGQLPLLTTMVAYTVGGLYLLFSG